MAKYRKRPVVIEALTFNEFVEKGKELVDTLHDGFPWAFKFNGSEVTHESNNCYIIATLEGDMQMTRQDMLIIGVKGEIYPCKLDIFEATYDKVEEAVAQ